MAWSCLCCDAQGLGDDGERPTPIERHHFECPERPTDADPEKVRELRSKLARACTLYNIEMHAAIDAGIRVQQLRAAGTVVLPVVLDPLRCPSCGGGTLDLIEQLPDHGLFEYRCRKCQTEFRAA
jgi:hypothetical protein